MSVTSFLLLLTPLALVIAAYIIWPLLGRRSEAARGAGAGAGADSIAAAGDTAAVVASRVADAASAAHDATNRAVIAERRAQLDEEIKDLPADSAERRQRIAEFTRAALADLEPIASRTPAMVAAAGSAAATTPAGSAAVAAQAARRRPFRMTLVIALLFLLLAVPLIGYRIVGTPEWPGIVASRQTEERDIRTMVAEVERRLAEHPNDAQGWLILGRTRLALGETAAGLSALERALTVDSSDPNLSAQIRTDLADALARSGSVELTGRPTTLVNEALARSPSNPKALALAGAFAAARGDTAQARNLWQKLLSGLPAGSEQARQVEGLLAQIPADGTAADAAAATSGATAAATPGTSSSTSSGTSPVATPGLAANGGGPAAAGPRLTGRIELDPGLVTQAQPDDTVFIVARGLDANDEPSGPPVAVQRVRVADLPYDFVLDEHAAMTPTATLAHQSRVRIVARISRSGTARPGPGDIEGHSAPVANDANGVTVRLDRPIP